VAKRLTQYPMPKQSTNTQMMRERLLSGVPDSPEERSPGRIIADTWSKEFEDYMRNRLVTGHFRYGVHVDEGACYKKVSSAISRLQAYLATGNLEHLVDAANLAMMEYGNPCEHDDPHFEAADDGAHTEQL